MSWMISILQPSCSPGKLVILEQLMQLLMFLLQVELCCQYEIVLLRATQTAELQIK